MSEITLEDVQAQVPSAAGLALARGRDERREGHPDPGQRVRAALLRAARLLRRSRARSRRARTCRASRRSSTTRSARWCSASPRCARRRSPSTSPRRSATARARAAPRCTSRRAIRSTSRRPESGILTQEIYSLLGVAVASEAGTRRLVGVRAQGMTACPCAQTLVEARSRERLIDGRLLRRGDRADLRGRPGRHAQPARARHAAHRLPGGLRHRHRRRGAAGDRRGLDVVGDLRADEALRRGRGGREGAPAPAVRRGLRARDGARRGRRLPDPHGPALRVGPPGEPGDDPPAQRDRRAVRAAGRDARASSRQASTPRITSRCASGSTARA